MIRKLFNQIIFCTSLEIIIRIIYFRSNFLQSKILPEMSKVVNIVFLIRIFPRTEMAWDLSCLPSKRKSSSIWKSRPILQRGKYCYLTRSGEKFTYIYMAIKLFLVHCQDWVTRPWKWRPFTALPWSYHTLTGGFPGTEGDLAPSQVTYLS